MNDSHISPDTHDYLHIPETCADCPRLHSYYQEYEDYVYKQAEITESYSGEELDKMLHLAIASSILNNLEVRDPNDVRDGLLEQGTYLIKSLSEVKNQVQEQTNALTDHCDGPLRRVIEDEFTTYIIALCSSRAIPDYSPGYAIEPARVERRRD